MKIFKNRVFDDWAVGEKLTDEALRTAIEEMEGGLIDANLGGSVYKKRVATKGKGKSGGVRTIIAFRIEDKVFFIYGFAKKQKDNISAKELKTLKAMAKELFSYSDKMIEELIDDGVLIEVENDG